MHGKVEALFPNCAQTPKNCLELAPPCLNRRIMPFNVSRTDCHPHLMGLKWTICKAEPFGHNTGVW